MSLRQTIIYSSIILLIISSCSRKHVPETTSKETPGTKTESSVVKKTVVKRKAAPKMIAVNDKAAKKSVDGRLYYDLEGHRYWKNYTDGKYYLFNRSMYSNKAFKPPSN